MRDPNLTWDELDVLNSFEHAGVLYAREIRDLGYSDPAEALAKLDGLVALAAEHRARIIRRAERDADRFAREEMETAIPPVGA
jgi:hypothetical protein